MMEAAENSLPVDADAGQDGALTLSEIRAARIFLLVVYTAVAAVYFSWRLTVFNHAAPVLSWLFYLFELTGFCGGLVFLFSVLNLAARAPAPAPLPGLTVDVLVPTYNEPVGIVRRTMIAALRMSYPHTTWLLDDGNRPVMRALAEELGCRYIARTQNTHAKAGNLNNALMQAKADFVAMFDADFIAAPDFLDRTLGYFSNPKISFVQTPQEYYNYDSYQHVGKNRAMEAWSEHSLFFRVIQRGRDRFNAAMFCGCAAVLRRKALDDIGGVATGTVTEDMHTSVRLHNAGWELVFHAETLSAGLAPHDALGFRRQRLRWSQGSMQVLRREKLLSGGSKGLSPLQRLMYMMHVTANAEGLRHILIYLIPALTLFSGITPFDYDMEFTAWVKYGLTYFVLSFFCLGEFARGHRRLLKSEVFNLARCPTSIRSTLALVGTRHIPFFVTPKIKARTGYLFPWLILAATLAAIGKTGYAAWYGLLDFTGWPLCLLLAWACLSAYIAAQVCMLTRRCAENRRGFSRFAAAMPVTLYQAGIAFPAVITGFSDAGLSLKPARAGAALPEGPCTGILHFDREDVPFGVGLRATQPGAATGGALSWQKSADRDAYEYLILVRRIRWLATFDDVTLNTRLKPLIFLKRRLFWASPVPDAA